MTEALQAVAAQAADKLGASITAVTLSRGELTLEIKREDIAKVCRVLRDDPVFGFEQLIDVCGVDYSTYGTESDDGARAGSRFAAIYHLLSIKHNRRLRLRAYLDDEMPRIDSVYEIWASANWFEREAFDLFGIIFEGHPDLRRILTDYGFIGHPFRKDFPLIGHVEMRYDESKRRVVYQPVTIEPRVQVPRVVRDEGFARD
ncbi:MAG: NADH-quinone oxidoreductase subunit C [Candidatus Muproteobacteria bacterium RBG_16_60_9]|uniref:NADH-quinone oxidoreductase subunit C n=1 Tax=Candidatus Muproteobacteria bacterium RBG_16_60_9 TaxID=1817755 RepID=A0A1F6VID0_9PROT|nr:MAG: NADH-quinone oxidoreductase subunit C [Candidatus Muproteobacteria bacterium RBG_16_60_9]